MTVTSEFSLSVALTSSTKEISDTTSSALTLASIGADELNINTPDNNKEKSVLFFFDIHRANPPWKLFFISIS